MPIIKSAKKRARQDIIRRERNADTKRRLREAIRDFDAAVKTGKKAEISKRLIVVQSELDTAVKKNLIHKNRAARKLSRLNQHAQANTGASTAKSTAKKPAAKKTATKKSTTKKAQSKTKA